jgi:putative ABC transport system permease protein
MLLKSDLQYAVRLLWKRPGHTLTTLFVMALGLALYLASYSYVRSHKNIPMPFPDGDSYVVLKAVDPILEYDVWQDAFDQYTYERLKSASDKYSLLAAIQFSSATFSDDGNYAKQYSAAALPAELLSATSVKPELGRLLTPADSDSGAGNVVIISHGVWQDYYGGDPAIVGSSTRINRESYTVIGVMPEGFAFPVQQDLWFPLRLANAFQPGGGNRVSIAGILGPGIGMDAAEAELDGLVRQLAHEYPDDYAVRTVLVTPYAEAIEASISPVYLMMLILAFIVLALSVVNLSALLLMRSTARKEELALRAAVGAGGLELVKQVLLESALICFLGLALSLAGSKFLLQGMQSLTATPSFWHTSEVSLQTILVGAAVTFGIWLCTGLVVAYRAWRTDPSSMLSSANKGAGDGGGGKTSVVIVAAEVTLTCFLLVAIGVTVVVTNNLAVTDFGTPTQNTVFATFDLANVDREDKRRQLGFADGLIREVLEVPGISEAAITTSVPGMTGRSGTYRYNDYVASEDNEELPAQATVWVSDNYFDALGISLVEGRGFDESNSEASTNVVIITDKFARQLWPEQSPLGKSFVSVMNDEEVTLTVVGLIPDTLKQDVAVNPSRPMPILYRPLAQGTPTRVFLVVKHEPQLTLAEVEQAIRTAGASVDRNVALESFRALDEYLENGDIAKVMAILQMIIFATLFLAVIGIYAVLERSVSQRTREIGIRRALGSTDFRIFLTFIKLGVYILLFGTIVGGLSALAVWIFGLIALGSSSLIYLLPIIWAGVTLLMLSIIAVACYIPVRGAISRDVADTLRDE